VITGRRASQGGARASLQPLEVDSKGLLKLNPLCSWTYHSVEQYALTHSVPVNALLSQGYRSIGDWHSTEKPAEGEGERAGRWKGTTKTECGLHVDYLKKRAQANVKLPSIRDRSQTRLTSHRIEEINRDQCLINMCF
jgi:phosphoadenosine phosphosulfate reductase